MAHRALSMNVVAATLIGCTPAPPAATPPTASAPPPGTAPTAASSDGPSDNPLVPASSSAPSDLRCESPASTAHFAVAFLEANGADVEIVFLTDDSLCGGDAQCPNALATYVSSSRVTTIRCAWRGGEFCNKTSYEFRSETPESEPVQLCFRYAIEVIDAPSAPGTRGKLQISAHAEDTPIAPVPIEVLVSDWKRTP